MWHHVIFKLITKASLLAGVGFAFAMNWGGKISRYPMFIQQCKANEFLMGPQDPNIHYDLIFLRS